MLAIVIAEGMATRSRAAAIPVAIETGLTYAPSRARGPGRFDPWPSVAPTPQHVLMAGGAWRAWLPVWSVPSALRAVRAAVVVPAVFAFGLLVLGNLQLATYAAFGGVATLVMAGFGGSRRDQLAAHLELAAAGCVLLTIGTAVSWSVALAAVVTLPVVFLVLFAGILGPNAAIGATAALLAFVLPAASPGTIEMVPSRLAGWLLASFAGTAAVILLSPRPPENRLRSALTASLDAIADVLTAALDGIPTEERWQAAVEAKHALLHAFMAAPARPTGLALADQGLARLVDSAEWTTTAVGDALADRAPWGAARTVLQLSVDMLRDGAALMRGAARQPDFGALEAQRADVLAQVRESSGTAFTEPVHAAFHANAVALAARTVGMNALAAAGRIDAAELGDLQRGWYGIAGREASTLRQHPVLAGLERLVSGHASLRSVWFRNSVRGAVALAAAVAVADLSNVQHGFWVVLGTLSVLRSNALGTGGTAWRALLGTVVGFFIGGALFLAIGANRPVLWAVLPVAVLVASYVPGTAPFAFGQAVFTVTLFVLFNLLMPVGWQVGLLRLEDVALGCGVGVLVGVLFWPRGAAAVVVDDLADAFRRGAAYLADAARWTLGLRPTAPESAEAAIAAGLRLEDALRGFFAEQGAKHIAREDLWRLVGAAQRLRQTANSLAGVHETTPDRDTGPLLTERADRVAGWYRELAGLLTDPGARTGEPAANLAAEARVQETASEQHPRCVWAALNLDHLQSYLGDVRASAERAAELRQRPWWR